MTWDDVADDWDDDPAVVAYSDAAHRTLLERAEHLDIDVSGSIACDFGCGTGLLTERLAPLCDSIDSIDPSPAMLGVLQAKIDRFGWTDVHALDRLRQPIEARYDLIACSSVLGFVDDYPATVGALVASLRPGGLLVQWDWERDPDGDVDADDGDEREPFGMTVDQIRSTLVAAGLSDVAVGPGFEVRIEDRVMRPLMGSGRLSAG